MRFRNSNDLRTKNAVKNSIAITKTTHSKIDFVKAVPCPSVVAGFVRLLGAEKKGVLEVVLAMVLLGVIAGLVTELKLVVVDAPEAPAALRTSFIVEPFLS